VVYDNGTLTVGQATLTVTAASASRTYGTANPTFSASATGAVNGDTFSFAETTTATLTSPVGSYAIVPVATGANLANYTVVYVNGTLTVGQATLTVTTASASRTYGTANPTFSASATGAVNGDTFTFTETTTATATSPVGSYPIVPVATGTNLGDYTVVYDNGTLTIGQATPVITWANPAIIIYGTALSSDQLNASSSVAGTLVYAPIAGSIPVAGTDTLSVTFTPSDTIDYTTATKSVQLTVAQATPVLTWANPASITYGTALSSTQLNASAYPSNGSGPLAGTFAYSPAAGTVLSIGSQGLSVTFTPTDTSDYTSATKTVSLSVTQATLTVLANNFTRLYGTANPVFTGSITGMENGDTFTESFSNSAGILSQVGQYTIVPAASGVDLSDYVQIVQNGTLTITQAPVIMTTNLSSNLIVSGLNVTMTTSVASTTSGTPTGTVNFFDNGNPLGTVVLSNGIATYSTTTLPVGTNVISTIYSGDLNFTPSSASGASGTTTVNVTPLDFTFQVTSQPTLSGIYGTSGQYTLHVAPTGGSFPGDVQFTVTGEGPISSTYTFSPATVGKNGGPTDITFTLATHKLASLETPKDLSSKLSHVAFGLFLLPLLTLRYSRRSSKKLTRMLSHLALVLLSLGAISSLTGCGSGYFDHVYPITITATSNGVQHTVTVDYHIEASPQ
jgi:Bacterial Ig-like domain (group 3)/MBG domain (YGX type)